MKWFKRTPKEKRGTRRAVYTLWFLAPFCGEMMSGSMPPLEWLLNPVAVLIIAMLYGSGALLIREFVRRWDKGWMSILLLGLAYGIYEEGMVVRSFFDPTWQDLDILAEYGRWLGVNWIWTFNLTLFHSVVSITIPILLVELMYPDLKNERWLTRRGMKYHGLMFGSLIVLGLGFEMEATGLALLGCTVVIAVLWRRARHWSPSVPETIPAEVPRLRKIMAFGFLGSLAFFTTMWLIPNWGWPALIDTALIFWLPVWGYRRARRLNVWAWGPREQWAIATGVLSLWIMFAFLGAAGPSMPLAGILCSVMLWRLGRRIRARVVPLPTDAQLVPPPAPDVIVPA